jgi:2-dehydro-3-deoxy-D-arabinonate dehydratase
MKVCRFKTRAGEVRVGLVADDSGLLDLTPAGITHLRQVLESADPVAQLNQISRTNLSLVPLPEVTICAPVEQHDFSASAYDRVYAAERPELFFKSLAEKVIATGERVGIRHDARWSVPEPELVLVLNSRGKIVGHTIGNDMSSRDIEGENLLYLPQAKIYERSCALGPWITLATAEAAAREWTIGLRIERSGKEVFGGKTSVGQIKRRFEELAEFLFRCQSFPHGAVLLTGTGIVPPDSFTLQAGDIIEIEISGIGRLRNSVVVV